MKYDAESAVIREMAAWKLAPEPGRRPGVVRWRVFVRLVDGMTWETCFHAKAPPTIARMAARLIRQPKAWERA